VCCFWLEYVGLSDPVEGFVNRNLRHNGACQDEGCCHRPHLRREEVDESNLLLPPLSLPIYVQLKHQLEIPSAHPVVLVVCGIGFPPVLHSPLSTRPCLLCVSVDRQGRQRRQGRQGRQGRQRRQIIGSRRREARDIPVARFIETTNIPSNVNTQSCCLLSALCSMLWPLLYSLLCSALCSLLSALCSLLSSLSSMLSAVCSCLLCSLLCSALCSLLSALCSHLFALWCLLFCSCLLSALCSLFLLFALSKRMSQKGPQQECLTSRQNQPHRGGGNAPCREAKTPPPDKPSLWMGPTHPLVKQRIMVHTVQHYKASRSAIAKARLGKKF
jgi:hypothetical protein